MASILIYLKNIDENTKQGTVTVRFTHNREHFPKSTGVKVRVKDFDAGRLKPRAANAATENAKIDAIRSQMERALQSVIKKDLEPTTANVRAAWGRWAVLDAGAQQQAPKVARINNSIEADLRAQIAALESQLSVKRAELADHLTTGNENLLSTLIWDFTTIQRDTPLAPGTIKNYQKVSRIVGRVLPTLTITDLDETTLAGFRDKMVKDGLRNSTIGEYLIKIKVVVKYYADEYKINSLFLSKVKEGKTLKDKPVIFLTPPELSELEYFQLLKPRQQYIRDLFLLSCYTGLRHVDLHFSETQLNDNYIQLLTSKNTKILDVPFSKKAAYLMDRMKNNKYKYEPQLVGNFTADVKKILAKMPSFQITQPATISLAGSEAKEVPRWKLVGSKAGRKTFINNCLIKQVPIEVVAGWVGHSSLEMILNHYSNKRAQSDAQRHKLDL